MSTCGDCRHWLAATTRRHGEEALGFCRRFPPTRLPLPAGWQEDAMVHNLSRTQVAHAVSAYPVTRIDEACGELSPKEAA